LEITLTRITPYTGGQVPKKKSLMIESAQTILGGIKENSQSLKVPIQSWEHKEKSKGSKNLSKKKKERKKPRQ